LRFRNIVVYCGMKQTQEPIKMLEIPTIESSKKSKNEDSFESNYHKYEDQCAVCGKGIKSVKYEINTIYGGEMYLANDHENYNDAWRMAVGSECQKKIPVEYLIKK